MITSKSDLKLGMHESGHEIWDYQLFLDEFNNGCGMTGMHSLNEAIRELEADGVLIKQSDEPGNRIWIFQSIELTICRFPNGDVNYGIGKQSHKTLDEACDYARSLGLTELRREVYTYSGDQCDVNRDLPPINLTA